MKTGYIDRRLAVTVKRAVEFFPVICITGPRQSGKSTLIRNLFSDYKRYSLDDLDVRAFAQNDPVAFLAQNDGGMIIDEIQQIPQLMSHIKGIVDEHPERKFILSGSSNFMLLKSMSESLAGRAGVFELLPMSYSEIRDVCHTWTLDRVLYNGLYPAICAAKNIPEYLYPSYIRTYLERDVRNIVNVSSLMQFHTFLKLCAGRIGSVFNASELANELGVASNTISSWLSVLEASYVVFRLQPWSENTGKRLTKSPKLYFCDTGLACCLLGIDSPEQLACDKMRGHLFENFVIMEKLKERLNSGKDNNLFFFRDAKGNEIDLLQFESGTLRAWEIKSSMTYNPSFADTLSRTETLLRTPVSEKTIVYAGELENNAGEIRLSSYKNFG